MIFKKIIPRMNSDYFLKAILPKKTSSNLVSNKKAPPPSPINMQVKMFVFNIHLNHSLYYNLCFYLLGYLYWNLVTALVLTAQFIQEKHVFLFM